ncbi:hypothetical protein KTQ42_19615 [Noviherbaspirillum sp. L7-7A]|uniref:hypothetical protein n=1 Tax=Noviherbaspirillum sp. L7-7A TaxID=2850560 RepID=UPI001C2BF5C9|nr:hypothetical protein [Noviherbaspirillum sp. L7-7A]MBV0881499.1 hypothetical protein [Noviherbaspirillum sp. L7-7A]
MKTSRKGDDPMGENGIESESSEAASRAPSQFEAPQISLPKGGGAISGIARSLTAWIAAPIYAFNDACSLSSRMVGTSSAEWQS